jgi:folate-binding Fe-S cluster repair protein YgfZ
MHSLHFRKGCYVGQESISKTVSMTSNAVRRRLCALALSPSPSSSVMDRVHAGDHIIDLDGKHITCEIRHDWLTFVAVSTTSNKKKI